MNILKVAAKIGGIVKRKNNLTPEIVKSDIVQSQVIDFSRKNIKNTTRDAISCNYYHYKMLK